MGNRFYAMVWINHRDAEVLHFSASEESKVVINSHLSVQRLHQQSQADGSKHEPVDTDFFYRIASALNHTGGTLIAGPGDAKFELERYLRQNRPDLAAHVHDVGTLDRPGDAQLIELAREHFRIAA